MSDSTSFPNDVHLSSEFRKLVERCNDPVAASRAAVVLLKGLEATREIDEQRIYAVWQVEVALSAFALATRGNDDVRNQLAIDLARFPKVVDEETVSRLLNVDASESRGDAIQRLRAMPYAEYLLTDVWQGIRERALIAAGYTCQLCDATPTSTTPLHVHHRRYTNRGNENPGDLIVLCKTCHSKFHDRLPQQAETSWWDE